MTFLYPILKHIIIIIIAPPIFPIFAHCLFANQWRWLMQRLFRFQYIKKCSFIYFRRQGRVEHCHIKSRTAPDGTRKYFLVGPKGFDNLYRLINYYQINPLKSERFEITLMDPVPQVRSIFWCLVVTINLNFAHWSFYKRFLVSYTYKNCLVI